MRLNPMKESLISSLEGDGDGMDCESERGIIWKPDITLLRGEMKEAKQGKRD
jgi:hypothetical protein